MAHCYDRESRIKQIQACGETIKDLAEKIVNTYEYNVSHDINIHIEPGGLPTLTITQSILSEKIVGVLRDEEMG